MIHRRLLNIAVGVLAPSIFMVGCAPGVRVDVPEFHGRVLDADSRPIKDAVIEVSADRDGHRVVTLMAKPDGTFSHREQSRLVIYFAGGDPTIESFSVSAMQNGNRSAAVKVWSDFRTWWVICSPATNRLGDLRIP
jgi:hypothetical protein